MAKEVVLYCRVGCENLGGSRGEVCGRGVGAIECVGAAKENTGMVGVGLE